MENEKKALVRFPHSWKFVLLFSVVVGLAVGIIDCIPIFKDTSLTDPAVSFEAWIPLAIFVIWGGKNTWDATAKCFTFFLISQPLIYLVEVVCEVMGGDPIGQTLHQYFVIYYIGAGWFTWTLLTIPGSAIAYQVKRDNVLSALILSVATCGLTALGAFYIVEQLATNFPRHLLTTIFCFVTAFALCAMLLKKKHTRITALVITALSVLVFVPLSLTALNKPIQCNDFRELEKPAVSCTVEDETVAVASLEDGTILNVNTAEKVGETVVHVTFEDGTTAAYQITVDTEALHMEKLS